MVGPHDLGSDCEQLGIVVANAFAIVVVVSVTCAYVGIAVSYFEYGRGGKTILRVRVDRRRC